MVTTREQSIMGILTGLNEHKTADIKAEVDSLGGGGVLSADAYDFIIKLAYVVQSAKGAKGIALQLESPRGNMNTTVYITNREGKPFYERNGSKQFMPGFNQMNAMSLLAEQVELGNNVTEMKTIKLYDFNESKEVPKEVEVLTEWTGKEITIGVTESLEDKNVKNPNFNADAPEHKDNNPAYIPSGETRKSNDIDKIFRTRDGLTINEITAEEDSGFKAKWVEKNKDQVRDRTTKVPGVAGQAGAPAGAGAAAGQTKSLFG
jgi:hypothetical protein